MLGATGTRDTRCYRYNGEKFTLTQNHKHVNVFYKNMVAHLGVSKYMEDISSPFLYTFDASNLSPEGLVGGTNTWGKTFGESLILLCDVMIKKFESSVSQSDFVKDDSFNKMNNFFNNLYQVDVK